MESCTRLPGAAMEFRVLGTIEAGEAERPIDLGRPKQRALLALLLLHANEVLATDRILDELWGDDPPAGGGKTLQVHVAHLRKALEPDRATGAKSSLLETRSPGYMLHVDPAALDATLFEDRLKAAESAAQSDPEGALSTLNDALQLWRGRPYADVAYEPFAQAEIRRLEELQSTAFELRVDCELRLGRHASLIGELETLIERHPFRERMWGQLMVALYRSGRQADALRAFTRAGDVLAELGIEPSAELRNLEDRILQQDPVLLSPSPVETAPSRVRGYELRGPIGEGASGVTYRAYQPSVGREVAIKAVPAEVANHAEFVQRFESEARIVAQLAHPHIVPLYDFWREPDAAYLVMPLMRGRNLWHTLGTGPLEPKKSLRIVEQVGSALAYAHSRGVVHCDVHPGNVLLSEDGDAYLADFGIARRLGDRDTEASTFTSPEQSAGHTATVRSDVHGLGMLALAALAGDVPKPDSTGPALAELEPELADVVGTAIAPQPADRYRSIDEFLDDLRRLIAPRRAPASEPETIRNPYKGLRAFSEADAGDFFGRASLVNDLLDAVAHHGLVAVIGASGSGKSSAVHAGLVPAIRSGRLDGGWLIADLFPGGDPFGELEAALLGVAVEPVADLGARLRNDPANAVAKVRGLLPATSRLLLIVDQFEELFTLSPADDIRRTFMDTLAQLATDPGNRIRVVITLRADFLDRPLSHARFGDLVRHAAVMVTPLSEPELVAVITRPAQAVGIELEAGIDTDLVRDVRDQPGGLPLLEFALTELFERRSEGRIERSTYEASGGVLGALGARAEDRFNHLDEPAREAARQLFLRLVAVDEGGDCTKRRVALDEFHRLPVETAALDRVLAVFGESRLLTFDRDPTTRTPTVEVAHEAILDRWPRLRSWIDDRRDDLVLERRLHEAVAEWRDQSREPAYLLSGGRLDHFETWAQETDLSLTSEESEYLQASRTQADDLDRRQRERRRIVMAGFACAAVVAVVLAVVAFVNQQAAERNATEAQTQQAAAEVSAAEAEASAAEAERLQKAAEISAEGLATAHRASRARELASASAAAQTIDPELAILLALEAAGVTRDAGEGVTREATEALHAAVMAARPYLDLPSGWDAAVLPDGDVVIAGSRTERWDPATGTSSVRYDPFQLGGDVRLLANTPIAASADGRYVAAVGPEISEIAIFDAATGELLSSQVIGMKPEITAISFSRDGALLAAGNTDGWVRVWDVERVFEDSGPGPDFREADDPGQMLWSTETTGWHVRDLTFSPRGEHLAVAGPGDTEAWILDVASGEIAVRLEAPFTTLTAKFLSSGEHVVTTSYDGTIRLYDAGDGSLVRTQPSEGSIQTTAVSAVDDLIAIGGSGGDLELWRVSRTGFRLIERLYGHTDFIGDMEFGPDGTKLVTTTHWEGTERTRVWDISRRSGGEWGVIDPTSGAAIVFSPDGSNLATSWDSDQHVALFNTTTWEQATVLEGAGRLVSGGLGAAEGAAFNPDGTKLVTTAWDGAGVDGSVILWDLESGEETHLVSGVAARGGVDFSNDGTLVAATVWHQETRQPILRVWDVATANEVFSAPSLSNSKAGFRVDFHPDGNLLAVTTGARENNVLIWDLRTERPSRIGTHGPAFHGAVRFSPDGETLLTAGSDGVIKIWDYTSKRIVQELRGHVGPVEDAHWADAGATIVSTGEDGTIRFWDAATGREQLLLNQGYLVSHLALSPDGNMLATSGYDGISGLTQVWALDLDDLIEIAKSRLHRGLTDAELCTYYFDECSLDE